MRSISSFRNLARAATLILSCLSFTAEALGADSYDASTNRLTIPFVLVNGATYTTKWARHRHSSHPRHGVQIGAVMSNTFAFGGTNACLILGQTIIS